MDGSRPTSRLAPALIAAGILSALLALYVAGYFHLGQRFDDPLSATIDRVFSAEWQARAFIPAAFLEAKITGVGVALCTGFPEGESYNFYAEAWKFDP